MGNRPKVYDKPIYLGKTCDNAPACFGMVMQNYEGGMPYCQSCGACCPNAIERKPEDPRVKIIDGKEYFFPDGY